jgi:hypothetical protein
MKKFILLIIFIYANIYAQTFYYNAISNSSKTIDYFIAFYPEIALIQSDADGIITVIKTVVINGKDADPLECNDNKWFLLLKDGTLIGNYTTAATSDDDACIYTVHPGETHVQSVKYKYARKIRLSDIKGVWFFSNGQLFKTYKNQ